MSKTELCVESYSRLKNLKLVEKETGVKWQTVYVHLKKAGVSVTGDKKRYGSSTDKLAAKFEQKFNDIVKFAVNNNDSKWQSTVDFYVNDISIDVKVSRLQKAGSQPSGKKYSARWAYCISKQKDIADFFVMFAIDDEDVINHIFLIPDEIAVNQSTISIPQTMDSKWADFKISENELVEFFAEFKK